MLIRLRKKSEVFSSEITPQDVYLNRRHLIKGLGAAAGSIALGTTAISRAYGATLPHSGEISGIVPGYKKLGAQDEITSEADATTHNNFYEFGTGRRDPSENSGSFKPRPWQVKVDGLCANPGLLDLDDLVKPHTIEERIYRLRCVEAWSMVIPWAGIPLADVVKRFEPLGSAKFIRFETLFRPEEMPGQRRSHILPWPYVEGLRLDEASNPLSILAVGMYGSVLPKQNGAPLRLVVPWKYGFKSIKSIVRITFTEDEPKNTWQVMNAPEYGFYANVNPNVDHPRWSQATEQRIGECESIFMRCPRRNTLMFNGYEEEVAHMYTGMDLARYY